VTLEANRFLAHTVLVAGSRPAAHLTVWW